MMEIGASVGAWEKGARNVKEDVVIVQKLLTRAAGQLGRPDLDPRGIDGGIAKPPTKSDTVKAIKAFQSLVGIGPDGVVDPGGRTWQKLAGAGNGVVEPPSAGDACFPFAKAAVADWTHSPRAFGSNRSGGQRAHAGCDLYAPVGRTIYAVRDGVVMRDPYLFYAETDALEIDHGEFVIRYGEIKQGCTLRKGDKVTMGQPIAQVGLLVGIQVPSAMLHLEMYKGSGSGPLSVARDVSARRADGVAFMRRSDLIDPTPFLNDWNTRLAKP
jgi:murein DD-endopeptidase MepM/ murein hydrolase activator NlpD